MNDDWIAIPIIAIIFSSILAIVHLSTRHRERMTMIAKGLAPDEIKAYYSQQFGSGDSQMSLKWGILFVFVGLALLVGNVLHDRFGVDDGVIFGMVCICAGSALLLFYGIANKKPSQV